MKKIGEFIILDETLVNIRAITQLSEKHMTHTPGRPLSF